MWEPVKQILDETAAALDAGGLDEAKIADIQQRIKDLPVFCDQDLSESLLAPVFLLDLLANRISDGEERTQILDARESLLAIHSQMFGDPNTPFLQGRRILTDFRSALLDNEDDIEAADLAQQNAATNLLAIEGLDSDVVALLNLGIQSMSLYWHTIYDIGKGNTEGSEESIYAITCFAVGLTPQGIGPTWVKDAVQLCEECHPPTDPTQAANLFLLASLAIGTALQLRPDVLPGLKPLTDLAISALTVYSSQSEPPAVEETAPPDFATQCRAVLDNFESRIKANGFSQYEMEQAGANLRELPGATDGDNSEVLINALIELMDLSIPYADADLLAALQAARQQLTGMKTRDFGKLPKGRLKAEGDAILLQLEQILATGANPNGAIVTALTDLQILAKRIPDDEEDDDLEAFLTEILPRVVSLAASAVSPDGQGIADQVNEMFSDFSKMLPTLLKADGTDLKIQGEEMQSLANRMATVEAADEMNNENEYHSQIYTSLRDWGLRLTGLYDINTEVEYDQREASRLKDRLHGALERGRSIKDLYQFAEQMHRSFCPLAQDLRVFELRRHLTLIEPPWGVQHVVEKPHSVFVCGGAVIQQLVDAARQQIGLSEPPTFALRDPVEMRWQQLRAAGVAVFDFTSYDSTLYAAQDLPIDMSIERNFLERAAPVAAAAYEAGLALLLGIPMVIVANEGQTLPFDIDVQPVYLRGDGEDIDRIVTALITAVFGVQRKTNGDGLVYTLSRVREKVASWPKALELLDAVTTTADALQVRHIADAALREASLDRSTLLVTPAFPAPPIASAAEVFHVTAFRDWTRPLENEVLRKVCQEAGLVYHIGYEDIDPTVIRAIWIGISQARTVVADITTLNPNAVFELAIAQAMGKPLLILSRQAQVPQWLPALKKVRVHPYTVDADGIAALKKLVLRFFADATS